MISAYQNCKDKKQVARNAHGTYEKHIDLIETSRANLTAIDNLVDLRKSLNAISKKKRKNTA